MASNGTAVGSAHNHRTVAPVRPQKKASELDEILNDIFQDTEAAESAVRERTLANTWGTREREFSSPQGCLSTQDDGGGQTVLTWQTSQEGPRKCVTVSKETVKRSGAGRQDALPPARFTDERSLLDVVDGRRFQGGPPSYQESRTLQTHTEMKTRERLLSPVFRRPVNNADRPRVPPAPPNRRRVISPDMVTDGGGTTVHLSRSDISSPPSQGFPSTAAVPQKRSTVSTHRNYASDSEEALTWLEEQRRKLELKRATGRTSNYHRQQQQQQNDRSKSSTDFTRTNYTRGPGLPQSDTDDFVNPSTKSGIHHLKSSLSEDSLSRTQGKTSRAGYSRTLEPPRFTKDYGGSFSRFKPVESRRRWDDTVDSNRGRDDRFYDVSSIQRPSSATPHTKYSFTMPGPSSSQYDEYGRWARPAGLSAPTSPVIPARGISSRDAVVRSKGMASEWFGARENATYDRLEDGEQTLRKGSGVHLTAPLKPVPTEAERISLLPIGRGVQDLEPGETVDGGTLDFRRSTPTLNRTNQGDYAALRNQELRSKSSLGRSSAQVMTSPASQRRDFNYATMPISTTTGHASALRDSSSVFAPIQRPLASLAPAPPSGDSTTYQAERRMYSETVRGSLPGSGQLGYDVQQHGHVLSNAGQQQQATNRQLVTQQWLQQQQQPLSQQQQQFSQQEVQYRQQIQQQHQLQQQQEQQLLLQEQQRQLQLQEQQRQLQLQEEQRLFQLKQEQQRQFQLQEQQRQLQLQEQQRQLQLQQEQQRQLQIQEEQRLLQIQEQQRQLQIQEEQRQLQLKLEQQRQLQLQQEQQRQLQLQEEQRLLQIQEQQRQLQLQEQQRQLQLQEEQRQLQLQQEQQRQLQLKLEQQRQLQLQEEQRLLQLQQEQQRQLQIQEQQRQLQIQHEQQRQLQLQQEQQRQLQIQEEQRLLQIQEQQRQLQIQEQQRQLQIQEQQRQLQLQQEQQRQVQLQQEQQRQLQQQQQQQQFHSQTIQRMYVVEQKSESRHQPNASQTLDSRVGETSFSSAQPLSQFAFRESSSSFVEPHRSTISDASVQVNASSSNQFNSEQRGAQLQSGSGDQEIEVSQAIAGRTAVGQVSGNQVSGNQVSGSQIGGNQVALNQVGGNQVLLNPTGGQVIEQRYVVERQVIGRGQTGSQASSVGQVGGQSGTNKFEVQQPTGGQVIEQRYIVEREVIGRGQGGHLQQGTNLSVGQGDLHVNQTGGQMAHVAGTGQGAYQTAYQGGTQTGTLQASHQQGNTYKTVENNSWVQSTGTQQAGTAHREQQGVRFGGVNIGTTGESKALSGSGGFSERVEVMSAERDRQQQQQQQQHQQQQHQQQQHQQQHQQQQQQSYGYEFQQTGEQGSDGSVWTMQRGGTNDGRSISAAGIGSINPGGSWTLRPEVSRSGGGHQRNASGSYVNAPRFSLSGTRTASDTCITDGAVWSHQPPRFVRDTSKYWHKPNISRDDAIGLLLDKPPGSFVVRSSSTFPGSFGLALKVSQVPPNMQTKGGDPQIDLVRHFLIEPTPKGVRLKGCSNEPVFASLAALIYQHSVTPLSLPCKLKLPDEDIDTIDSSASLSGPDSQLNGAACTVLYMGSVETENLTGPEALARSIKELFESGRPLPRSTIVQFKVTRDGITLTDNRRRIFFRRFYPIQTITFCGADPRDRRWTVKSEDITISGKAFGFVARKPGVARENACHVFLELDPTQPANVIVNYVTKVIIGQGQRLLQ